MDKRFIGIYDVFSAMIVSTKHTNLFLSGLSYTASTYGLPDIGFMTWRDVIYITENIKSRCANTNLLVDVDDGFGGAEIASYVTKELEKVGAWGIVLEDQARPKKCGHLDGKQVVPIDSYLEILEAVILSKKKLFIVARTDSTDFEEQVKRLAIFSKYPVDAILVDGISIERYIELKKLTNKKLFLNYIHGGSALLKPEYISLIDYIIYSTQCIGSAALAISKATQSIKTDLIFHEYEGFNLNEIRNITEKDFRA